MRDGDEGTDNIVGGGFAPLIEFATRWKPVREGGPGMGTVARSVNSAPPLGLSENILNQQPDKSTRIYPYAFTLQPSQVCGSSLPSAACPPLVQLPSGGLSCSRNYRSHLLLIRCLLDSDCRSFHLLQVSPVPEFFLPAVGIAQ
jgi:hypothetical protein